MFNTIRFKTSVLYSSILGVILAVFSVYLFHTDRQIFYQNTMDDLRVKAEEIDEIIDAYADVGAYSNAPEVVFMRKFLSQHSNVIDGREVVDRLWAKDVHALTMAGDMFRIVNLQGQLILRSPNMTEEMGAFFERYLEECKEKECFSRTRVGAMSFYALNYPFMFSDHAKLILQIATPLTAVERTLSRLLFFMIGGIIVILVVTLFMGAFFTRRVLGPVAEVTRTANTISKGNLGVRIKDQVRDREMAILVDSFNQMIGRLEKSFAHVNEFSSQVAHELKTPLAIMKGELELALSSPDIREDEARVITVTLQEVDRLIRVVKDLLLLANFEYKMDIFKMEKLELYGFLRDTFQRVRVLAEEKGLKLDFLLPEGELFLKGDPAHLKRLFFNLGHNAVKFTPAGGSIRVSADLRDGKVLVMVEDTGEGIAPKDQAMIFQKFYRVRKAGQEDSGTGLGLAMAMSIVKAHNGDISLKSEPKKGSIFTVTLPV